MEYGLELVNLERELYLSSNAMHFGSISFTKLFYVFKTYGLVKYVKKDVKK